MVNPVMIRMKSVDENIEGYSHWCEGCGMEHRIITKRMNNGPLWNFDNNLKHPTFYPSVRIKLGVDKEGEQRICHYFLKDGLLWYCGDTTHHLSGMSVSLPPFPEDYLDDDELQDVVSYLD